MQKKIMILGGTGLLGKCLIKTCQITYGALLRKQQLLLFGKVAGAPNGDVLRNMTRMKRIRGKESVYICRLVEKSGMPLPLDVKLCVECCMDHPVHVGARIESTMNRSVHHSNCLHRITA